MEKLYKASFRSIPILESKLTLFYIVVGKIFNVLLIKKYDQLQQENIYYTNSAGSNSDFGVSNVPRPTKQSYDFNSRAVLSLWPVTSPLNSRIVFYCKRERSAVKKVVLVLSVRVPTHSMLADQRREWREGTEEARFRSRVENRYSRVEKVKVCPDIQVYTYYFS